LLRVSVVSGAALAPLGWIALKEYQKQRILSFWNPDADPLGAGYTVIQSKIAVGSGGLLGKGWLSGTQNQLNFLPERHTDFIFSVIGEEWGFVGSLVLLFLFGLLFYRIYRVGLKAVDWEGRLLCVGVIVWISTQVLINICMTIGLMPVVGLPLPFLSKGGSHVMSTWFALGLVLSVSRTARR
ncbi:MAG: FtsW/RodA/SpoVE family cell cycle protein, partial [Candidatus Omnitrophica bacterium]|nr:FtsW/RodA/SpoVE family cell cycle protein [Candidatus Omnitrophota bacterium]